AKGKDAPCVLLLHNIGGHRKQEGWDVLAQRFQEKGYAVLSFDFRGHGDSTTVESQFWNYAPNKNGVPGLPPSGMKATIRQEDFQPIVYPFLSNDIAAAPMLLDRLHEEGKCNATTLIIIGAHEGATLGALWLSSECCRYQVASIKPPKLDPNAEGKHVVGALWLTISPSLGDRKPPLPDWWGLAGRGRKIPMTFVRGSEDMAAAELARSFIQEIKPALFSETVIPKTNASGHALLNQKLGTEASLLEFADLAVKDRPMTPWSWR